MHARNFQEVLEWLDHCCEVKDSKQRERDSQLSGAGSRATAKLNADAKRPSSVRLQPHSRIPCYYERQDVYILFEGQSLDRSS